VVGGDGRGVMDGREEEEEEEEVGTIRGFDWDEGRTTVRSTRGPLLESVLGVA
jgi:hypothetical protein